MIPKGLGECWDKSRVVVRALCLGWLVGAAFVSGSGAAPVLIDDRTTTIHEARDLRVKRRLLIDSVAPSHMIFHHAISTVLIPALRTTR